MSLFRFHWMENDDTSEVYASIAEEAFHKLGYGSGVLSAVDYFEVIKTYRVIKQEGPNQFVTVIEKELFSEIMEYVEKHYPEKFDRIHLSVFFDNKKVIKSLAAFNPKT